MENDLKIYIQTNPQQLLAAKVAEYSFKINGFENIEIINLTDNEILKNHFGKKYKRNGKIITFDPNDLQSFTLLRFFPPKICNTKYCLIIDPDIFAVKNFYNLLDLKNKNKFSLFCTKKNNKIKSEVMLINMKYFNLWNFDKIINDLFSFKLDYSDLINLDFINKNLIGLIDENFNSHDEITNNTIFLHTTNRITQPWKTGLNIDYSYHVSKYSLLINYIRKYVGLNYQKKLLEKKYQIHPKNEVIEFVKKLFNEAIKSKYITNEELSFSVKKKFISKEFFDSLKTE